MKKLLFFIALFSISSIGFSQVYFAESDGTAYEEGEEIGMPIEGDGLSLYVYNPGETAVYMAEITAIDIPDGAFLEICVPGVCVPNITSTGSVGLNFSLPSENNEIHILYFADGNTDPASLTLKVKNVANEDEYATIVVNTDLFVGNNELSNAKVEIHPNPATEFIKVAYTGSSSNSIVIYDMLGTTVDEFETPNGSDRVVVDVTGYQKGIYILKIGNICRKFIVR